MNPQQAAAFVQAINAMQPYVPPMIFSGVVHSDVARLLAAVANGQAICEVKSVQPGSQSA
jgi:hypothetical protein